MPESYTDTQIHNAAFAQAQQLMATRDQLTSDDLRAGFQFEGKRVPFINPQRGIFKPQRMQHLLSIRTVYPKAGGKIWYDDQRDVHEQIRLSGAIAAASREISCSNLQIRKLRVQGHNL